MSRLLIYGATGYTGRMAAQRAKALRLPFEIGGRDAEKLKYLAEQLQVPYRVFSANAEAALALPGITVLLNFAGPFVRTADPLIHACIKAGVDYLDITAEINTYRLAEKLGADAMASNVMLLPGVGWDVVPTDRLSVHVARRVETPMALRIGLQVPGSMSRGSAMSASEIVGAGVLARIDNELVPVPDALSRYFDFGDGPVLCAPLSFGDLVTAWYSTGVPDISMYVHVTGDAFPTGDLSLLPDGPTAAERDSHQARAVAEITGIDGNTARSVIETVNGYTYTPLSAIEAARRVLIGDRQSGFQTPARVFGSDFAKSIAGTAITDY